MDTVVVITDKLPNRPLTPEECAVKRLDFVEEVAACEKKRGGSHILGTNYLRAIADEVGRKYDKNFNAYRHVVPSDYQGFESHSVEDTALIVKQMFEARYPQIFSKYLEVKFKSRPFNAKVLYFLGSKDEAHVFESLGAKIVDFDQVDQYLLGSGVDSSLYKEKAARVMANSKLESQAVTPSVVEHPVSESVIQQESIAENVESAQPVNMEVSSESAVKANLTKKQPNKTPQKQNKTNSTSNEV